MVKFRHNSYEYAISKVLLGSFFLSFLIVTNILFAIAIIAVLWRRRRRSMVVAS
jgi:hypothetical protein